MMIHEMTDEDLVKAYRRERGSDALAHRIAIVTGARPGNRRSANHDLARLERRLGIMRNTAAARGLSLDSSAAAAAAVKPTPDPAPAPAEAGQVALFELAAVAA
jgi:hypothetical protein